jgi:Zn-dependent peptidase ImmA (M78 family)
MDIRALILRGVAAAGDLRDDLGLDPFAPVDPYAIAERLGIRVTFLEVSMEGFYANQNPPRILLSARRPLARRAFTCAHEIGHHYFGHGSIIDTLQEDDRADSQKPEEILANAFAAFLLMPTVGLRGAFARFGWDVQSASPTQLFTIACQYGVGYETLIHHLCRGTRDIPVGRRDELLRANPQRIRKELGLAEYPGLTIVHEQNEALSFDAEIGSAILLPAGTNTAGSTLEPVGTHRHGLLYRAVRTGVSVVTGLSQPCEIRVMRKDFIGAAANRFLEDPDEEE